MTGNAVTCEYATVSLASQAKVRWRRYVAPRGVALDEIAEVAQTLQAALVASPKTRDPAVLWLTHLRLPFYAVEGTDMPEALWMFVWSDTTLSVELENYLQALLLHSSGEYIVQQQHHPGSAAHAADPLPQSHTFFLRAICNAIADRLHDGFNMRVAGGLLRLNPFSCEFQAPSLACYTTFRAYTSQHTLYVMSNTEYTQWRPFDLRITPADAVPRDVVLGETQVRMLPSLQRATLLSTCVETQTEPHMSNVLSVLNDSFLHLSDQDSSHVAVLRISIREPPPTLPVDASDMRTGVNPRTTLCTVLWPLALCLRDESSHTETTQTPWPLYSAAQLLDSETWHTNSDAAEPDVLSEGGPGLEQSPLCTIASERIAEPSHMQTPNKNSPLSLMQDNMEGVFSSIGQLTQDELSFFEMPTTLSAFIEPPNAHAQPVCDPMGSSNIPTPTSPTPMTCPDALTHKYDEHGKFFTPGGRWRSSDDVTRIGLSPRFSFTSPQSASGNMAAWTSISPMFQSDESNDDDETDFAGTPSIVQRSLCLTRLRSSTAYPEQKPTYSRVSETRAMRMRLAWTALYAANAQHSLNLPRHAEPVLTAQVQSEPLPIPSIFAGCQQSFVQIHITALPFWTQLGLQPVAGKRTIHTHLVLVDSIVPLDSARAWLQALADQYSAQSLGTLTLGRVWQYKEGTWTHGSSPSLAKGHTVVILVYGDRRACERLYSAWPEPRADVTLLPVPQNDLLAYPIRQSLVWAAYEDPLHRVFQLAPRTFEVCHYLREKISFALAWPLQSSHDPLHQGAVLHVAYDRLAPVVRVVCTDDRAQRLVCRVWDASDVRTDILHAWEVICGVLADTFATWHVVIGRFSDMPAEEMQTWKFVISRKESFILSVGLLCLEPNAWPLIHTQPHAQPQVVYMADMPMALHTGQPLPVLRSAYMTHGVYAVHLLQSHDTYEMDAYFHDIVLHLYALECMTKARWPGLDIRLPWHFAILACA